GRRPARVLTVEPVPPRVSGGRRSHGRTLLIALVSILTAALPVVLQADPAAAQTLKPGFNLARTQDIGAFVPNSTNFVFLAGTNNLIGIGKCGEIGLGRMPNAD